MTPRPETPAEVLCDAIVTVGGVVSPAFVDKLIAELARRDVAIAFIDWGRRPWVDWPPPRSDWYKHEAEGHLWPRDYETSPLIYRP